MTTKEKHHKHPPIQKPILGHYHKCEWAIYGTTCAKINILYDTIQNTLQNRFKLGYVDADHNESNHKHQIQIAEKQYHYSKINKSNPYDDKSVLVDCDAVFVNGNHFPASKQIVIIDPNKKDSLQRRIEQLDNIDVIIKPKDIDIYDFILQKITKDTLTFNSEDVEGFINYIEKNITQSIPALKALILAGGKSQRMGMDKSQIKYHNKSQQVHLADMCMDLGLESYISKEINFASNEDYFYPVIKDRMDNMGPFGAIISAMMYDPNCAWLVIACDLPFLKKDLISKLIENRYHSGIATAFKSKSKPFPEPLISIYEPRAYPQFLKFLSLGYNCPRKILINSDVHILELENDYQIQNINTVSEKEIAVDQINKTK